jgi:CheY-like chemotaxis protein
MHYGASQLGSGSAQEREQQLRRLKSHFLASLNHEIRTPLTGILGMTDLLLETPLDDVQREYVVTARICAEELLALLDAALEYSALSSGDLPLEEAEFNLPELLESVLDQNRIKAHAKGLRLLANLDSLPTAVIGDAVRVRQIIAQLLGNAVKFTPAGEVELRARAVRAGEKRIVLEVTIRDTGIGIPPERLPHLFESFSPLEAGPGRRYSGLGLGLATVHRLLELMGGQIQVQSEPGRGSLFAVRIPLGVASEAPATAARPSAPMINGGSRRILLVEDDTVAQRIVAHMLGRAGYQVDAAGSGDAAIALASEVGYDLILMDLQMPGKDGIETAAEIRRLPGYQKVPIIALTAHTTEEFRSFTLAQGLEGFLTKPVRSEELLAVVRQHLQDGARGA